MDIPPLSASTLSLVTVCSTSGIRLLDRLHILSLQKEESQERPFDEVGFPALDDTGAQLLSRLVAAYERRALDIASH
ncbi:MAG: hypothetical protein QOG10_2040 [Kribbellaceae bacterium]|jgi:hypothetical protein|nr:hypothetical protein [Kribbellaceae bacterium]